MDVNRQVSTEEHLPGFQLQLGVCRRSKRRRFIYYYRRKQINDSFKLNLQSNIGKNGLFRIIRNTKRFQMMVVVPTVSGHFVPVDSKNALSAGNKIHKCALRAVYIENRLFQIFA